MASTTTKLELIQSARAAALAAHGKTPRQQYAIQGEAFDAAGHDPRDFKAWSDMFRNSISEVNDLSTQLAPSAEEDKKAARAAQLNTANAAPKADGTAPAATVAA